MGVVDQLEARQRRLGVVEALVGIRFGVIRRSGRLIRHLVDARMSATPQPVKPAAGRRRERPSFLSVALRVMLGTAASAFDTGQISLALLAVSANASR